MTTPSNQPTVFHLVLARLAAAGIECLGPSAGATYAAYQFADGSTLSWWATSDSGAESSVSHPLAAHANLDTFYYDDRTQGGKDEARCFDSGDFETDAAALITWVTSLAVTHGRAID